MKNTGGKYGIKKRRKGRKEWNIKEEKNKRIYEKMSSI